MNKFNKELQHIKMNRKDVPCRGEANPAYSIYNNCISLRKLIYSFLEDYDVAEYYTKENPDNHQDVRKDELVEVMNSFTSKVCGFRYKTTCKKFMYEEAIGTEVDIPRVLLDFQRYRNNPYVDWLKVGVDSQM